MSAAATMDAPVHKTKGVAKWKGTRKDSPILTRYVQHGLMYSELKELFQKLFQKECFAGLTLKMNQTPIKLNIKIKDPIEVLGENKFRLRQLQNMVAQRMGVPVKNIDIVFEKIADRGLEPAIHAESLRTCFLENRPYKRVINSVMRDVKNAGGQGAMVRISGKMKGQRAKSTRFANGLMITSGQPAKDYVKTTMTEAKCKQGVIGITVSVMLPYDSEGIKGPSRPIADKITILEPSTFN